jgi:hypothetical protein
MRLIHTHSPTKIRQASISPHLELVDKTSERNFVGGTQWGARIIFRAVLFLRQKLLLNFKQ